MASSPRILCLNLGMQTISIGDFRKNSNGGLTLQTFDFVELIADAGADATRNEQIKEAVERLREKLKIKRAERINYALPSQSVFTRFVKLPEASPDQIDQIIGFEAQQNVPFPIDEVVWDYQVLGKPHNEKIDVVLVAIKADQLIDINDAVESPGFHAGIIDVSPMALYNAFRYNYHELTGCSLVIDIGARTTNLLFVEDERVFSRSIPIGGNTITATIAKELNKDVFLAEELKKTKGFVGLGGAYADPEDETIAKISKLIRNTLTRLHAEIARSISFYRSNHAGSQPVRTYLVGGTVSFAYMREFFNEKLQMPIEFFNPLRNVIVSSTADLDSVSKNAHILGELVGLATRELGNPPIALNLRPLSVVQAQTLAKRKPYLIVAAACFFCILAAWGFYFYRAAEIKQQVLESVRHEVGNLDRYAKQFDDYFAEQKKIRDITDPLLMAIEERSTWASIINELGAKLPSHFIWITRVTPISNNGPLDLVNTLPAKNQNQPQQSAFAPPRPPSQPQPQQFLPPGSPQPPNQRQIAPPKNQITAIEVQGLYLENPKEASVIDEFVNNLEKSDKFTIQEKTKVIAQRSTPDGRSWAYGYTLVLPLKQPIDL